MGDPYTSVTVSGYNVNPPPDDGTTVATNKITWSGIKTKLGDPLNTFAASVNTNVDAAFAKTVSGASLISTAVSYPMTAADQGRLIKATASGITITTPDATVVKAPFVFWVANQSTGTITLAGNGAQTIDGSNTQVIRAGSGCMISTDGTNWFTSGLKPAQIQSTNPPYGFDMPVNLQLNASVATNLLTIAVKTNSGNDPSASDPVLIPFRDSTLTAGDPVWVSITSALSINTNATGATLGTSNSVPFRFWIVAFNNAGTAVLGLINCSTQSSTAVTIYPLNETALASSTAISAAATSAGVFYTPNGTTLTSKAFRIIGWLEYNAGLATAGTYGGAPTTLQLFGPGCKKPGDVVQEVFAASTTGVSTTANSTTKANWGTTVAITPTSAANPIKVTGAGVLNSAITSAGNQAAIASLYRGTNATPIGNLSVSKGNSANNFEGPVYLFDYDNPQTTSSTTYGIFIQTTTASGASNQATFLPTTDSISANQGSILAQEIMG